MPVLYPHQHDEGDSIEDGGHHEIVYSKKYKVHQDLWITGLQVNLVNLPKYVVHHVNLNQQVASTEHLNWLRSETGIITLGSDNLTTPNNAPSGYGVFVPKDSFLVLLAMFHNPLPPYGEGKVIENAAIQMTLDVELGSKDYKNSFDFYYLTLVDPPSKDSFIVPSGKEGDLFIKEPGDLDIDSAKVIFSKPGTIITIGSHTHAWDGGRNVNLYLNDKLVYELTPRQFSNRLWDCGRLVVSTTSLLKLTGVILYISLVLIFNVLPLFVEL